MTRFLSTIILTSLIAFSQSKIIFNYTTIDSGQDVQSDSFNVGVDFFETDFNDLSITKMKPRTEWKLVSDAGPLNITLNIAFIRGTLTKGDLGTCNIAGEHTEEDHQEISVTGTTPLDAMAKMNTAIAEVAEGVNYSSSFGNGPQEIQLNIKRASAELAQAIIVANCDTLNLTFNLLI